MHLGTCPLSVRSRRAIDWDSRKPHRFLYLQTLNGNTLVDYLGPRCRECAGLRFASQGPRGAHGSPSRKIRL